MWVGLAVAIFCIVRGIVDLRDKRYIWGIVGIVAGLALMAVPVESRAVLVDIPLAPDP